MTENKSKALEKMLSESEGKNDLWHYVHNWLCNQEDDVMFTNFLKEGKSIQNAINFMIKRARDTKADCMTDQQGFDIIVEYINSDLSDVASVGVVQKTPKYKIPKKVKKEETEEEIGDNEVDDNETDDGEDMEETEEVKAETKPTPTKAKKEDGQISIFDLFGESDVYK